MGYIQGTVSLKFNSEEYVDLRKYINKVKFNKSQNGFSVLNIVCEQTTVIYSFSFGKQVYLDPRISGHFSDLRHSEGVYDPVKPVKWTDNKQWAKIGYLLRPPSDKLWTSLTLKLDLFCFASCFVKDLILRLMLYHRNYVVKQRGRIMFITYFHKTKPFPVRHRNSQKVVGLRLGGQYLCLGSYNF